MAAADFHVLLEGKEPHTKEASATTQKPWILVAASVLITASLTAIIFLVQILVFFLLLMFVLFFQGYLLLWGCRRYVKA